MSQGLLQALNSLHKIFFSSGNLWSSFYFPDQTFPNIDLVVHDLEMHLSQDTASSSLRYNLSVPSVVAQICRIPLLLQNLLHSVF